MARKRLPMRRVRDVLRLKWQQGLSNREAADSLGVSPGTVGKMLARARDVQLDWTTAQQLNDVELERRLFGSRPEAGSARPLPDPTWMHRELRRKGVTLELLHLEYLEQFPEGYRYTAFCDHYRRWLKKRGLSMHQVHKAGEKAFVDYSGKRPEVVNRHTGEITQVELFVAVLGASGLTYVEATRTQGSEDWIGSHVRAFEFFGGLPALIVCDQLKSGVTTPCRYEPGMQRTYEEWARHSDTALLPARARKPKDKAKVERAVLTAQRWILARMRNETLFSLAALNVRIRELVRELNERPMRTYGNLSRRQLFDQLERNELRPVPAERFEYGEWKDARVNIDYHVAFERHCYSVPHPLVHEQVEVRATVGVIEVFLRGRRVASHRRSAVAGGYTTVPKHMPKAHQKHLEWTPSRLIRWAGTAGPNVQLLVETILESRPHPEQGYRSTLGILRLQKTYGDERLDAACARAMSVGARSYRHVQSILKNGLDRVAVDEAAVDHQPILHGNVRGPDYYQ